MRGVASEGEDIMSKFQRGRVTRVTFEVEYPDGSTTTSEVNDTQDLKMIAFSGDCVSPDAIGQYNAPRILVAARRRSSQSERVRRVPPLVLFEGQSLRGLMTPHPVWGCSGNPALWNLEKDLPQLGESMETVVTDHLWNGSTVKCLVPVLLRHGITRSKSTQIQDSASILVEPVPHRLSAEPAGAAGSRHQPQPNPLPTRSEMNSATPICD